MSVSSDPSDISAKIKEIVRSHGIEEPVAEVGVKDAGLQGEGFASKTLCVTVKFEKDAVKPLNLFVKVVSDNKAHTEMLDDGKAFEKEATFLTEYVPDARRLWKAKGLREDLLDLYPRCYFGDSRMIVLENLVVDGGYCLLSKGDRQDREAARFALQSLATHHAISHAMVESHGGPDPFFQRYRYLDLDGIVKPQFATVMGPMFSNTMESNIGLLENNAVAGRDESLTFLKGYQDVSLIELIVNSTKCEDDTFRVLNHGDYWNNNMLFLKDDKTQKIIGHKAIDFQVTRYNSPVLDLSYYLFSSVKTDIRVAHLKELLHIYYDTLKSVANDLGYPIKWTFEQVFVEYKKRLDFGFWFAMCIVIGPGLEVMKDVDINKVDINDWAAVFNDLMRKWIAANPAHAKVVAEDIVKLCREYKTLSLEGVSSRP